jgi:ATP-dependent DNA ligase
MARSLPVMSRGSRYLTCFAGPRRKTDALLVAFDLLELDGADLRGRPLEERTRRLRNFLSVKGKRSIVAAF